MPKPQERDLEQTKVTFANWLELKLENINNLNVELLGGPENTGFSNETLSFNVSYSLDGDDVKKGMVLRFYPEGFFVFPDYPFFCIFVDLRLKRHIFHFLCYF